MQFRAVGPVPGGTIQAKGPGLPPGQTSLPTNLVVVVFLHTEHVLILYAFLCIQGDDFTKSIVPQSSYNVRSVSYVL
jgi:hypothetical protein